MRLLSGCAYRRALTRRNVRASTPVPSEVTATQEPSCDFVRNAHGVVPVFGYLPAKLEHAGS